MSSLMSTLPRQTLNPRQAETVERLFAAAQSVLDDVGHEQLTVRMVAAKAGVSPATAYTYFASKEHLFAELVWRLLSADPGPQLSGRTPVTRLQQTTRHLSLLFAGAPELAAAVNKSLLGSDSEVQRFRIAIGTLFISRFRDAIGQDADDDLIMAIVFAFSGALLQAGMGLMAYDDLPDTLDATMAVIMKGQRGSR